jgi:hypothetical protein
MHLVLAPGADVGASPETPSGSGRCFGGQVIGPLGLLEVIETACGLRRPQADELERLAAWQAKLARVSGDPFWRASFEMDAWATARTLLGWRDELVAAGARVADLVGLRLGALAAAEVAGPVLPPGAADRLAAAVTRLSGQRALPIDRLRVSGGTRRWTVGVRRLIDAIRACGVPVEAANRPVVAATGDLRRVQTWLTGGARERLEGDGSFAIVWAQSELAAADAAASWLDAAHGDGADRLTVLAGGDTRLLDAALRRLGVPALGRTVPSQSRGVLQVLRLAFATRWAPFDPRAVMDLLLLPTSPVPSWAGRALARRLSEAPGREPAAWQAIYDVARGRQALRLEAEAIPAEDLHARLAAADERWADWLLGDLHDPAHGMPVGEAVIVCSRFGHWARSHAAATGDPLFTAAAAVADQLADALTKAGAKAFNAIQLDAMLNDAIGPGLTDPNSGPEASNWTLIERPGAVWAPIRSLFWWSCIGPVAAPPPAPWTPEEKADLASRLVVLDDSGSVAEALAAECREAVLWASERVVLVAPRSVAGEPTATHPLIHEIRPLLGTRSVAVEVDAEIIFAAARPALAGLRVARSPVVASRLPTPRRDWTFDAAALPVHQRLSPTGLERLLGCPLSWTLRDGAGLRSGRRAEIPEGDRLIGLLAHAVAEEVFRPGPPPAAEEARRCAEAALARLVPARAASLLLRGAAGQYGEAVSSIARAMGALAEFLADRELAIVGLEQQGRAVDPFGLGFDLEGRMDLVAEAAGGRRVVIDLKWARGLRHRRNEVEEGRSIQLAAYARLLRDESAGFPSGTYLMLRQRRALSSDATLGGDQAVPGPALDETWEAVQQTVRSVWADLHAGRASAAGVPPDGADEPPEPAPPAPREPCRFCDFGRLCGKMVAR